MFEPSIATAQPGALLLTAHFCVYNAGSALVLLVANVRGEALAAAAAAPRHARAR